MKKVSVIVLVLGLITIPTLAIAAPTIIDFEDIGLAPGERINPDDGESIISNGYIFSPTDNTQFHDVHIGNSIAAWAYNGTTVLNTHDESFMMEVANGDEFSLLSFDLAGFPTNNEVSFSLLASNGSLASFDPDGIVDGKDGNVDFETFYLGSGFTNITSVLFIHTGTGTNQGIFHLDNIVVDSNPVPAPGAFMLGSLGAGFVGWLRRRRTL